MIEQQLCLRKRNKDRVIERKVYMKIRMIGILCVVVFQSYAGNGADKNNVNDTTTHRRYVNSILGFGQVAVNTFGSGVKYCGAIPLKKNPKLSVGPSLFYERIEFRKTLTIPSKIKEASIALYNPGLNLESSLKPWLILQFGFSAIIGSESITYNSVGGRAVQRPETNVIGGMHLEQMLFIKREEKTGFLVGFGIFERFITSSFYETDFGGRVYAGFSF